MLAGALVAALLAGGLAWIGLSALGTTKPVSAGRERVVALGAASVSVPGDWAPERLADAGLPALGVPAEVLAPAPGLSAHAVVVLSPGALPVPLQRLLGDLGRGRPASLAGMPATAYGQRRVGGDRLAELTVTRTTSGVLSVTCVAHAESWTGALGCADSVAAGRGLRAAP